MEKDAVIRSETTETTVELKKPVMSQEEMDRARFEAVMHRVPTLKVPVH